MKNKVVTYLKGLKKEQWIVWLLLAALLVVIAIPVNRESGKEDRAGDTGTAGTEEAGGGNPGDAAPEETAGSLEEQMAASLEEAL